MGAAMTRGGAIAFLETLTDTIGGRVTGSPQSQAASELILQTLKDAGFDDAHIEDYPLTSRWRRGPASGGVVSPVKQPILIGSYGWSPGTNGRVEAPLVRHGRSCRWQALRRSGKVARSRGAGRSDKRHRPFFCSQLRGKALRSCPPTRRSRCSGYADPVREARPHALHIRSGHLSARSSATAVHRQGRCSFRTPPLEKGRGKDRAWMCRIPSTCLP